MKYRRREKRREEERKPSERQSLSSEYILGVSCGNAAETKAFTTAENLAVIHPDSTASILSGFF